jgi:hypothetical protein
MSIGFESVHGALFGDNNNHAHTHVDILNQAIKCLTKRNAETMALNKAMEIKSPHKQVKRGKTQ